MVIVSLEYYESLSGNEKQFIHNSAQQNAISLIHNLVLMTKVARTDNNGIKYISCHSQQQIMVIISLEYYENLSENVKQFIYKSMQQNCYSLFPKFGLTDYIGKGR